MSEFSLEKALAGAPVRTRDGRDVTDLKLSTAVVYPVASKAACEVWTADGHYHSDRSHSRFDLEMVDEPTQPAGLKQYRHKKTGTVYKMLGYVLDKDIETKKVLYTQDGSQMYTRSAEEFFSRFEEVS